MPKISKTTQTSGRPTIVFLGSGPVAAASLDFLADHFDIEAVITKTVPPHHREPAPVEALAKDRKLVTYFANNKQELDTLIAEKSLSSRLGVIVDYGVIVSQATIDSFELGIVNAHFSLLPRWRGADPISFSILAGDEKTGVSLMLIEPSLDTGKLIAQKSLKLDADETTPSLTIRLVNLSNQLLLEHLPAYFMGERPLRAQPHPDRVTFSRKLTKEDGQLDWQKPATVLEREIRAFIDWPKSHAIIEDKEVIITKAEVVSASGSPGTLQLSSDKKELIVHCGEASLRILKLKPSGKGEMDVQSFINGYLKTR